MKKTILITALILSGFAFNNIISQVNVSLRVNIGSQPAWGPSGYDYVDYYYMPDIHTFYYVPRHQYIYQERGRWVFRSTLPSRFHYDVYSGYKVVINEPTPYRDAESYRRKYSSYRGHHDQEIIRNSHDSKYYRIRGHPEYNNWRKNNRHRNGK